MWQAPYLLRWICGDSHWSYPSLRREPPFQTRSPLWWPDFSNKWAFGLQELQASFPPPLRKDQVHPSAHSKQLIRGMSHPLRLFSDARQLHFIRALHKTEQAIDSVEKLLFNKSSSLQNGFDLYSLSCWIISFVVFGTEALIAEKYIHDFSWIKVFHLNLHGNMIFEGRKSIRIELLCRILDCPIHKSTGLRYYALISWTIFSQNHPSLPKMLYPQ